MTLSTCNNPAASLKVVVYTLRLSKAAKHLNFSPESRLVNTQFVNGSPPYATEKHFGKTKSPICPPFLLVLCFVWKSLAKTVDMINIVSAG